LFVSFGGGGGGEAADTLGTILQITSLNFENECCEI